jgi:tetratricopeptide (TPR) repeat protein
MSCDASSPSANHTLIYWQRRAGLNNTRFAAAIRERAGKLGHRHVQPDARRVRAWRQGERPRDPVPELVVEVLSEHIGMSLTLSDVGFTRSGAKRAHWDEPWSLTHTVAELITSARGDLLLGRNGAQQLWPQEFLEGQNLLNIVQSWTTTVPDSFSIGIRKGRKRIGNQEVLQILAVTDAFRSLDNAFGGGLTREAAIGQLVSTASLVEETTYTEEVGRKLITGIGDLAAVAGWMCHDVSMHTAAQHYFLLALQAAKEADDPNLGAHVLSCMARQAGHLGRPRDALEMIHLARYGARNTATPTIDALLRILEARYYAMMGRLKDFDRAAGLAETAFADCDPTQDPAWVAYFDCSEYYATLGICHQIAARTSAAGQPRRAIEMISCALACRDPSRVRSLAFDHLGLARAYLTAGELESAGAAGTEALELMGKVGSTRVRDRLHELLDETSPYADAPIIADLRSRILDQSAT